uniref:Uncharacterized protein n=1 Tax=Nelumbo nucifera TaxID=4432 RepID=A0A822XD45_NELNU|nr:TPA_asm: hypothetical protein HUJ06_019255 [Nelumbo nucifera]
MGERGMTEKREGEIKNKKKKTREEESRDRGTPFRRSEMNSILVEIKKVSLYLY